MEKSLELIIVAVLLIVGIVITVSLLQGGISSLSNIGKNSTSGSSCDIAYQRLQSSLECDGSYGTENVNTEAKSIITENKDCSWALGQTDEDAVTGTAINICTR